MTAKSPSWRWLLCFFSIAMIGVALDLLTKNAISGTLSDEQRVPGAFIRRDIIPNWFSLLTNSQLNKGALFSLGDNFKDVANLFFITISSLAILGILAWAFWPNLKRPAIYTVTLGFVLAGAIGNVFDRLVYGGVRDWIWVYYQRGEKDYPFSWPVFNLADCFLVGGAILLVIHSIFWSAPAKETVAVASTLPAKN
ncbi:MAG TPA: signal peptidase II [Gemmatales bacterium]|nr:signal peptidase II [Gemmatales bacterium]